MALRPRERLLGDPHMKAHFDAKFKLHLKGKKVAGFVDVDCGDYHAPGIRFDDGSLLLIHADPECNGPGFAELIDKDEEPIGACGV